MSTTENRALNPFSNAPVVASPTGASAMALVQREAQDIQAQMIVARHFPRDVMRAADKITNAFARPGLCEKALYSYARGGTEITGLSIRAAEVLARHWGNIRCGVAFLSQDNNRTECLAYAQDLESGFSEERRFFVKHIRDTRQGPKVLTDERDIYELAANMGARRKRACILSVIDSDVQEMAIQQIHITLKAKAEVTPERITNLLEKFSEYGVSKEQIEKRIQRRIESMLPAQLLQLGKIYNSLHDGMSAPGDWFEALPAQSIENKAPDGQPPPATQTEAVKDKLRGKVAPKPSPEPTRSSDLGGKIPQYSVESAIAALRAAATKSAVDQVWKDIVADFRDTGREVPLDVEAVKNDVRAKYEP